MSTGLRNWAVHEPTVFHSCWLVSGFWSRRRSIVVVCVQCVQCQGTFCAPNIKSDLENVRGGLREGSHLKARKDGPFVNPTPSDKSARYAERYVGGCAEIRPEYRLFLASLALAVSREDLVQWCFDYRAELVAEPPLRSLSWTSGTNAFSVPSTISPLDNSHNVSRRAPLGVEPATQAAQEDSMAATAPAPRTVGHVHQKGRRWYLTFAKDGARKAVNLASVDDTDEAQARKLGEEVVRLGGILPPDPDPTLEQFIRERFVPEYVNVKLKHAGKGHYEDRFRLILPLLGQRKFKDIKHPDLQVLINQKREEGYSWQTLKHIRNTLSAVFRHGMERVGLYVPQIPGVNPASGLILPPKSITRERRSASIEECRALLQALPSHPRRPAREMARLAICCSVGRAELAALRWRWTNLSDQAVTVDGVLLPPRALRVTEDFYEGHFGTTKTPSRVRSVPLPIKCVEELTVLRARGHHTDPNDLVFCNRSGGPVLFANIDRDIMRPTIQRLIKAGSLIARLGWHELRHTHATLVQQLGMPYLDAKANMGHMGGSTTLAYTHPAIENRRQFVEELSLLIDTQPEI